MTRRRNAPTYPVGLSSDTVRPTTNRSDIFVVGSPRSGTSWIQHVLSAHPDIITTPETHLFIGLRDFVAGADSSGPRTGFQHCVRPEQLTEWLRSIWETVRGNLLELEPGATRVLEKTPGHVHCIDLIRSVVPGARFVHVVRDPRDVVRSLLEASTSWASTWAPGDVEGAIEMWSSSIRSALETDLADDVITVRYEALQSGPLAWEPVLRHLGIDPAWQLDHLDERPRAGNRMVRVSSAPDALWDVPGFSYHDREPGHKRELSAFEQRVVVARCAELAAPFGYDLGGSSRLRESDRIRLTAQRLRRRGTAMWHRRSPFGKLP